MIKSWKTSRVREIDLRQELAVVKCEPKVYSPSFVAVLNNSQRLELTGSNDVAAQTKYTIEEIDHSHLWKGSYSPTFNSMGAN